MARKQYFSVRNSPFSNFHRNLHDGISCVDLDFLAICPACAEPLLLSDTIYNRDNQFKGKSEWMNRPYKFIARKCEIPFFTIWYTVNEISEQERPVTQINIKRNYPNPNSKITKLTPDEMLQYLEWKVQQHIPQCKNKKYLLKRVKEATETNKNFKRLENYVKLLS